MLGKLSISVSYYYDLESNFAWWDFKKTILFHGDKTVSVENEVIMLKATRA